MGSQLGLDGMIDVLKAVAETTRLRILLLLRKTDLTVSDLTQILNQSQPRVSRHLRLLQEAGLIERYQEGAWAYFSLSYNAVRKGIIAAILDRVDQTDLSIAQDLKRLEDVKQQRSLVASAYFSKNAAQWDKLRLLHIPDNAVEKTMLDLVGKTPFHSMLDIGTGTGSLLKLFAPLYTRGIGVDINRDMLAVARVNLDNAGISQAQVRLGDATSLPIEHEKFDLVTIYQVLHFIDDPQSAICEAQRAMRAGGRFIIVDFATHDFEFLREQYAHLRLGFSDAQIEHWLKCAGLSLEKTVSFAPEENGNAKGLTVKLWFARDPRFLIADNNIIREIA